MRKAFAWVVAIAVIVIGHGNASAGRTFYGWLYGTEVMPERGVELQTWVLEKDNLGDGHKRETSVWWGPLIGVTDQLELALPIEFEWTSLDGVGSSFTLRRFGVEARYRFVTQDPENAPAFAPLLRVAVKRDVTTRDAVVAEADLVASYESGPVHALVDLGVAGQIKSGDAVFEVRPGAGVSVKVTDELRLGAEGYFEYNLKEGAGENWAAVGPNMAWTHGRFWLSGAALIGIDNIKFAPRFMFGVAF